MRDEGLPFPEAVERLAGDAGLALPARDPRAEAREKEQHSLYGVTEAAAAWFESELAGQRGAAARRYLDARGVDEETRAHFRIGFAPDSRTALRTKLEGDGVPEAMMLSAGLVIAPEDGGTPYDRFRVGSSSPSATGAAGSSPSAAGRWASASPSISTRRRRRSSPKAACSTATISPLPPPARPTG